MPVVLILTNVVDEWIAEPESGSNEDSTCDWVLRLCASGAGNGGEITRRRPGPYGLGGHRGPVPAPFSGGARMGPGRPKNVRPPLSLNEIKPGQVDDIF